MQVPVKRPKTQVPAAQESRFMKKRNRFKQTTTLQERLSRFSSDLRQQARSLEPNTEQATRLRRRIRQSEAALRLNDALTGGK